MKKKRCCTRIIQKFDDFILKCNPVCFEKFSAGQLGNQERTIAFEFLAFNICRALDEIDRAITSMQINFNNPVAW